MNLKSKKLAPKILVIGDLIIDHYMKGSSERISPEAPVPIVKIENENYILGGAGNVINNLRSMGAHADIISVIGNCKNAPILEKLIESIGVSTSNLVVEHNRTISKKTRISASNQQIVRFDEETIFDISLETQRTILKLFTDICSGYDLVILSDYNKGVLQDDVCSKIIKIAKQNALKVLVDPKGKDFTKYTGAFLITPNRYEAAEATGINIKDKDTLKKAASSLKNQFDLDYSIITLSENGIAVFDTTLRTHPAAAKEVFDITGAGDTVIASLGYALSNEIGIDESVKFANFAAGVVVEKLGTATVTIEEISLRQNFSEKPSLLSKLKTTEEIAEISKTMKKKNKKVIFTNGCFDLIHSGHISSLEQSRSYGDVLIVGLNSDASIRRLKGASRPINKEYDRVITLAGLSAVDFIVVFEGDTPDDLIRLIRPDILTKGRDYQGKDISGSEWSQEIKFTDIIQGKSSTTIIKDLNKVGDLDY